MLYNQIMTKTTAKKYLVAIRNSKIRNLTCDALSRSMGVYPEIIAENLSFFDPMLSMDMTRDLRELIPAIEDYIDKMEAIKPVEKQLHVNSLEIREYKSVSDFVYKKMTINGLVSKNIKLSEDDLKVLKKLVEIELTPKKRK